MGPGAGCVVDCVGVFGRVGAVGTLDEVEFKIEVGWRGGLRGYKWEQCAANENGRNMHFDGNLHDVFLEESNTQK